MAEPRKLNILSERFKGGAVPVLSDDERAANIAEFWSFMEKAGHNRPACAVTSNGEVPDAPITACAICPSKDEHGFGIK